MYLFLFKHVIELDDVYKLFFQTGILYSFCTVNEILGTATKDRTESLSSPQEGKSSRGKTILSITATVY